MGFKLDTFNWDAGKPKIALIAAVSENSVIGIENRLPWHLPADWENFKRITRGKPFIMGRNSYQAPDRLLSTYKSVILSSKPLADLCENCCRAGSLETAFNMLADEHEIFILGGQQVFEETIKWADYIYLTRVHTELTGDAFFPEPDEKEWKLVKKDYHASDRINIHDYTFLEYRRESGILS